MKSAVLLVMATCLCAGGASPAMAQQAPLEFAAVSIKKLEAGKRTHVPPDHSDPAGVQLRTSLRALIAYAYGVDLYQVAGTQPGWMNEILVVHATTSAPANDQQLRLMMRRALAERFGLKLAIATRPTPVLAFVAAPGGIKAKPLAPGRAPAVVDSPPGTLPFRFDSMQRLIRSLAIIQIGPQMFGRRFVDETGLTGRYDISFNLPFHPGTRMGRPVIETDWHGMIPGLKKLGIAVKPETVPMTVYTIASAHEPTPN